MNTTFTLDSTIEFKRWVLGFGQYARVLAPKKLADEVAEELSAALKKYRKNSQV